LSNHAGFSSLNQPVLSNEGSFLLRDTTGALATTNQQGNS